MQVLLFLCWIVEDEFGNLKAWGNKPVSILVVQQWVILCQTAAGWTGCGRGRCCLLVSFGFCAETSLHQHQSDVMGRFNHPLQSLPFLRPAPTMPFRISPPSQEFGDGFHFLSYVFLRSKNLFLWTECFDTHSIYIAPRPAFKSDIAMSLSKICDRQVIQKKKKSNITKATTWKDSFIYSNNCNSSYSHHAIMRFMVRSHAHLHIEQTDTASAHPPAACTICNNWFYSVWVKRRLLARFLFCFFCFLWERGKASQSSVITPCAEVIWASRSPGSEQSWLW